MHISNIVGKLGTVVGWGYTEKNRLSSTLLEATMPVVSHSTCLLSNRNFFGSYLSSKNFCAGFRNGASKILISKIEGGRLKKTNF